MNKKDRAELSRMMRDLRQIAIEEGCLTSISYKLNEIVNHFALDSSVYDEPRSETTGKHRTMSDVFEKLRDVVAFAYKMGYHEHGFDLVTEASDALGEWIDKATAAESKLDETATALRGFEKLAAARWGEIKSLETRLDACLDLIADAVANHESGGRCDMDLARAAVILARNESVVEKHTHSYGDDGRCSCGIHALD